MVPMLARTYGPRTKCYPCFVQPKLNGVRCLAQLTANGRVILQSRDEHIFRCLQHIETAVADLAPLTYGYLLDGELYVHGWRLQRTNGAAGVNRVSPRDDTHLIEYHIFDAVPTIVGGFNLPFADRFIPFKNAFPQYCPTETPIKIVETQYVNDPLETTRYLMHWTRLGYEGLMLRPPGPYELGQQNAKPYRSTSLWKLKHWEDGEFLCIGHTPGTGKASIGIGSLLLVTTGGKQFDCGTGFTDEERVELSIEVPVGKWVKVRFNSLTSDGIPTPCTFLSVLPTPP